MSVDIKPTEKLSESQIANLSKLGILTAEQVAEMRTQGLVKAPKVNENYTEAMLKVENDVKDIAYQTPTQGRMFIGKDKKKYVARFYWRCVKDADSSKSSQ